jgi:hypothetical protein
VIPLVLFLGTQAVQDRLPMSAKSKGDEIDGLKEQGIGRAKSECN